MVYLFAIVHIYIYIYMYIYSEYVMGDSDIRICGQVTAICDECTSERREQVN